jgi:hypothetical protein
MALESLRAGAGAARAAGAAWARARADRAPKRRRRNRVPVRRAAVADPLSRPGLRAAGQAGRKAARWAAQSAAGLRGVPRRCPAAAGRTTQQLLPSVLRVSSAAHAMAPVLHGLLLPLAPASR